MIVYKILKLMIPILFPLILVNCGYQFTTFKKNILNAENLSIGNFKNKTNNIGLENLLINELNEEIFCQQGERITFKNENCTAINVTIISLLEFQMQNSKNIRCLVINITFNLENIQKNTICNFEEIIEAEYYTTNLYEKKYKKVLRNKSIKLLLQKVSKTIITKINEHF